jgi:hypothetical protein
VLTRAHSSCQAVKHAIHERKVDILSLSFGFDHQVDEIGTALADKAGREVLIFAAAGNQGTNDQGSWPARLATTVAVYAADGDGTPYRKNPKIPSGDPGYAVLGVAVKTKTLNDESCLLSGTSIATPIAAGLAGNLIRFMRQRRTDYLCRECAAPPQERIIACNVRPGKSPLKEMEKIYDSLVRRMLTPDGIRVVFEMMTVQGDYERLKRLTPWKLFENYGKGTDLVKAILLRLKKV